MKIQEIDDLTLEGSKWNSQNGGEEKTQNNHWVEV